MATVTDTGVGYVEKTQRRKVLQRYRKQVGRLIIHVVAILLLIVFMAPVYWMIATSVKEPADVGNYPVEFWPREPRWENYIEVWRRANVPRYMLNSFRLAVMYTVLTVFTSSLAGYAFARFRIKHKSKLFSIVLATLIMPPMVNIIPQFLIFHRVGVLNTYLPWMFFGIGASAYHIFLFRQFFSSIPKDLEDAATIDGCSRASTFFRIIAPISTTAFAAGAIFAFQWTWSDYLLPSLYLQQARQTFAVAVARGLHAPFRPDYAPDYPVQLAGAVYFILPLAAMFFLMQKYIVKGVVTTGLKG
jgi:multiple sugar transport system permease protein